MLRDSAGVAQPTAEQVRQLALPVGKRDANDLDLRAGRARRDQASELAGLRSCSYEGQAWSKVWSRIMFGAAYLQTQTGRRKPAP